MELKLELFKDNIYKHFKKLDDCEKNYIIIPKRYVVPNSLALFLEEKECLFSNDDYECYTFNLKIISKAANLHYNLTHRTYSKFNDESDLDVLKSIEIEEFLSVHPAIIIDLKDVNENRNINLNVAYQIKYFEIETELNQIKEEIFENFQKHNYFNHFKLNNISICDKHLEFLITYKKDSRVIDSTKKINKYQVKYILEEQEMSILGMLRKLIMMSDTIRNYNKANKTKSTIKRIKTNAESIAKEKRDIEKARKSEIKELTDKFNKYLLEDYGNTDNEKLNQIIDLIRNY